APHHLIDVLDPWESGSVAWWLSESAAAVATIESRGRRALFVGGTPLFLKALIYGLFSGPTADPALRRRLELWAAEKGTPALHERLAGIDPAAAAKIGPNDLRRIIRALEVWELTGQTITSLQTEWTNRSAGPAPEVICLDIAREELYGRIDRRVS